MSPIGSPAPTNPPASFLTLFHKNALKRTCKLWTALTILRKPSLRKINTSRKSYFLFKLYRNDCMVAHPSGSNELPIPRTLSPALSTIFPSRGSAPISETHARPFHKTVSSSQRKSRDAKRAPPRLQLITSFPPRLHQYRSAECLLLSLIPTFCPRHRGSA